MLYPPGCFLFTTKRMVFERDNALVSITSPAIGISGDAKLVSPIASQ